MIYASKTHILGNKHEFHTQIYKHYFSWISNDLAQPYKPMRLLDHLVAMVCTY